MSDNVIVKAQKRSSPIANVACSVEVYPFEGGPYILQGGQIRQATVTKSLYDGAGTMTVALAPGGPDGVEGLGWSQVITPMSHMLIGMSRGSRGAVVMDGVALAPEEKQTWSVSEQGSSASRTQIINGADFGWFYKSFNFFALTFHGLMAGTPVGDGLGLQSLPGSLAALLTQGLTGNDGFQSPVQIGRLWYDTVMAGASGILAKTFVPFIGGTRVPFGKAVAAQWEYYSGAYIPATDYFMVAEESWLEKFRNIFPTPWYEFFVTTAPSGAYLAAAGAALSGVIEPGTTFALQSMPWVPPGGPVMVARVNPTPLFTPPAGGSGAPPAGIDTDRWSNLPVYDFTLEAYSFLDSSVSFSAEEARNFYQLNPTSLGGLVGINNANNLPAAFIFPVAGDAASVQRYGFRPQIGTTRWLYDAQGKMPQSRNSFTDTVLYLTAALASWYHPMPLMAQAQVTIPLTPDILVGMRFRYVPYKDNVKWEFYVVAFQHNFVFGGTSTTTLSLSRGLPKSVYADPALLQAVFTGNAMRAGGAYEVGLPSGTGPSLQFVTTSNQTAELNQRLSNVPNTPQAK